MTENAQAMDNTSRFRLIGNSLLSYRFTAPQPTDLFVGDIVKISDMERGYTFFAKVTELRQGSNYQSSGWDTRSDAEHGYHVSPEVFVEVEAMPLGFIDERGILQPPATIPTIFSPVSRPDAKDLAFLQKVMGEITIGEMKSGRKVISGVRVGIPSRVLPQHVGVFGTTGMGKSNFMKVFCASCMKLREFGLLIVDPHGEYVGGTGAGMVTRSLGLVHNTAARDGLAIFSIRSAEERERYGMHELWLEYDDLRMSDIGAVFELSGPLRDVVDSLDPFPGSDIIDFFLHEGVDSLPSAIKTSSSVSKYPDMAEVLRASLREPLRGVQQRIELLAGENKHILRESGSSIPEIIRELHENKVVVIDIPLMSERSELFLLNVLTRTILELRQLAVDRSDEGGGNAIPGQVLIAIEEAQRVLPSATAGSRIFYECAMEGRKFRIGLCVITQQPKNIDSRVLAQVNTYVVMGLADQGDRSIVMGNAKQDLHWMNTEIQTLGCGDVIISTIGIPFPISTHVFLYEDYIHSLEGDLAEKQDETPVKTV